MARPLGRPFDPGDRRRARAASASRDRILGIDVHRKRLETGRAGHRRVERAQRRAGSLFRERIPPAWHHIDVLLPLTVMGIAILGVLMVLSSTRGTDPDSYDFSFMRRQLVYMSVGFALMWLVASFDYRRLRTIAWLPYALVLLSLVLVLALGTENRGTQAWFQFGSFQLQPAELAKVAAIVVVAAVLARQDTPLQARWVLVSLAAVGVPVLLILMQPDLGTALAFGAIAVGMLLVGGTRTRHLVLITAFVTMAAIGIMTSDMLEDYQRDRLTTFLDPEGVAGGDEQTYNLDQAMIAVGSGGADGQGLFDGTQTRLGNVPEQHTDFIFAALGEELGFAGSALLLSLYCILCWRIWRTALIASDRFGMLLCVGVLSLLVFQMFQNIGMTVGIMPITGLPLPFMSYGGSSVIASWVAVGLVMNIHMRRLR